ncbi:MAG: D-alanyl-D-alanine carboxypeptidase [Pseudomonadales bacterium]|nr:D-alanyl-D-alanine carboxypeptidase [Pseudomonadales bacterium]MBP9032705.1 D-alanyl-D-alanine carboxypeptidase [Pseudomonadales bacterium]
MLRAEPQVETQPAAAWLLERDGVVLGARRADRRLPPASLAKLMTAVLWVQQPERLDAALRVSARAAAATGARAGLRAGERYRGRDLLAAMLIRSGNDACLALAEQAGGSVESFVMQMNSAAALLALHDTRFANPCGWDAEGQHSSARDLLQLAKIAMEYPEIRELVAQPAMRLATLDGRVTRELHNTNLLLGRLPGARGVKTGFTARGGKCLVALAERDGHAVWLVLLAAPERWWTAHALIERAFRDAPRS